MVQFHYIILQLENTSKNLESIGCEIRWRSFMNVILGDQRCSTVAKKSIVNIRFSRSREVKTVPIAMTFQRYFKKAMPHWRIWMEFSKHEFLILSIYEHYANIRIKKKTWNELNPNLMIFSFISTRIILNVWCSLS